MPITTCANLPWRINPPSKTFYDPERDGIPMPRSLGVHEHWNNGTDKKYSRNLGKAGRDRAFPSLKVRDVLEPSLRLAELLQLQIGYRYSGRGMVEAFFCMLGSGIDSPGNCVFGIILEPV